MDQPPDERRPASPWRATVPVMAMAAGLLFGTAASLVDNGAFGHEPASDLPSLIRERAEEVERLGAQAEALEAEIAQLGQQYAPVQALQERADQLAAGVGTAAVRGPALRVTLDDAGYTADTLPEGYTVDDVVVHQQDLQAVVNALWAGGAEAMMVMDQRIVATSSVQCVGNTLYLQGRVYSPPFTVTAIGDTSALRESLDTDPRVANYRAWADVLGLGYLVEDAGEVEMPEFGGTLTLTHAVPVAPLPAARNDGPADR